MRSPLVTLGLHIYGSNHAGGAIATYYRGERPWRELHAPARRFVIEADRRTGGRRKRETPPDPAPDPWLDDPVLVMPADRIARLIDDRSGPCSRPVAAAELLVPIIDDWVVRNWAFSVLRTAGVDLAGVLEIALGLWVEFGQSFRPHLWFTIEPVESDAGTGPMLWRSRRRSIDAPKTRAGEVARLFIDHCSGRVIDTDRTNCVVAVPRFDVDLTVVDDGAVHVQTIVGERLQDRDRIAAMCAVAAESRKIEGRLHLGSHEYGWLVRFETTIDADTSDDDSLSEIWEFLQVAADLREYFTP